MLRIFSLVLYGVRMSDDDSAAKQQRLRACSRSSCVLCIGIFMYVWKHTTLVCENAAVRESGVKLDRSLRDWFWNLKVGISERNAL